MCFLLYLRMLCQLSDHGMSLVKQVPIDDEETVRKVNEAAKKSCYSDTFHSSSFELNFFSCNYETRHPIKTKRFCKMCKC